MGNTVIPVLYDDYVEMLAAKTKIDAIKKMVETGTEYCSASIKVLLGVEQKVDDRNGVEQKVDDRNGTN